MAVLAGPKWGSTTLGAGATVTWSFGDLTTLKVPGLDGYLTFDSTIATQYRDTIRQAMSAWSAVANLNLVESADGATVNIRIGNKLIDGPGPTLGETANWNNVGAGVTLFTAAEVYFDTDAYGASFYSTAVHEIGHALGLDHTLVSTAAVMYATVTPQNTAGVLATDDISGITQLYGAKAASGGGGISLTTLQNAFTNILRIAPTSALALQATIALGDGTSVSNPVFGQAAGLASLAAQVVAGTMTTARAITAIGHYADATTAVGTLSYQFFTGKTPSAAGFDFLVNSATNANDLNDPYYAKFNLENRYINFAVNLGRLGEGSAGFQAGYGSLTLNDALKKAYLEIFGTAANDQKVADILTTARVAYLAGFGLDGNNGIGTKAAMVGYLLAEAVKADIGPYALSNDKFMSALGGGAAIFNTDLKVTYARMDDIAHTAGLVELVGVSDDYALAG